MQTYYEAEQAQAEEIIGRLREAPERDLGAAVDLINRLLLLLDRSKFADYVELMQHKRVLFFRNFVAGLFRGMGFAMGFMLLSALALYLLNALVDLGIPVLGDFIAQLLVYIESVQRAKGLG